MKSLVAYFSTKGTTKEVADKICKVVDGDLFEIEPVEPYTDDDLNWMNQESRSSIEMKDKKSRPALKNKVEDVSKYDEIYVLFPIWWYTAPHIINSFLESMDLNNKTVICCCTSGGSPIGNSVNDLRESAKGAILKNGGRFSKDVSIEEIKYWKENLL